MTTKTKDVALPQEEVVIEEPRMAADVELREMVDKKLNNLIGMWKERRKAHKTRLEAATLRLPGGYRYWDCLLLGPYQKTTLDRPSKIIAGGEPALMVGLIWVNPDNTPDGGVSGKVVMGGHEYYRCFEMINLSLVENVVLPGSDATGKFDNVPDDFIPIFWEFTLPDPGIHPMLYEVHFYVDIVQSAQPFATMATWHWDPEGDPWIPGWNPTSLPPEFPDYQIGPVPTASWPTSPHFDHDIPARFLVYHLGT